jgi:hypothetical protein
MSDGSDALELEHTIGFTGSFPNTLLLHPRHETGMLYALGPTVVLADATDPHAQIFLQKHDSVVSALDISVDGARLASGQIRQPSVRILATDLAAVAVRTAAVNAAAVTYALLCEAACTCRSVHTHTHTLMLFRRLPGLRLSF